MNKRDPDYESGQEALRRIFGDHIKRMNETQVEKALVEINLLGKQIQDKTQSLINNRINFIMARDRKDTKSLQQLTKEWKFERFELAKLYEKLKRIK